MRKSFERVGVVVGGMLGDEGKGKVTQWLLDKYHKPGQDMCCIRTSGGSNTGASVYTDKNTKVALHMLPVGAYRKDTMCYIGPNVYVNLDVLHAELATRKSISGIDTPVFIADTAHAVIPTHLRADADKEGKQALGSTKNGTSIAASQKYSYKGYQLRKLVKDKFALNCTQNIEGCFISDEDRRQTFSHIEAIQELGGVFVEPHDFMSSLDARTPIVVEGSQGVGLDVNHGWQYPYVSSGSFSTYGLLDGVGVMLQPHDIVMCMKPYLSYFGAQDLQTMSDCDEFRKHAGEFGSTTKRPRKLAWLDLRLLQRSADLICPSALVINHFDTINWYMDRHQAFYVFNAEGHAVALTQRVWENGNITPVGNFLVDLINEVVGADKVYVGVGPRKEDIELVC